MIIELKCLSCSSLAHINSTDLLRELIISADAPADAPYPYKFSDFSNFYYRIYDFRCYGSLEMVQAHSSACKNLEMRKSINKIDRANKTAAIKNFVSKSSPKTKNKPLLHHIELIKIEKVNKTIGLSNKTAHPLFHIKMNEKIYVYSFLGINIEKKIVLQCQKSAEKCFVLKHITPTDQLKDLIFEIEPNSMSKARFNHLDKNNPMVYELKSYDITNCQFLDNHKCKGLVSE
jgi:hypothetical protein